MVKMEPLAGVFSFLLLLSFANVCIGDTGSETVVVFQDGQTDVHNPGSNNTNINSKSFEFTVPAFVGGLINNEEFLAIISTSKFSTSSEKSYIEAVVRSSYGNYTKWTDAIKFTNASKIDSPYALWGDITAVMKKNKIYVLATTWNATQDIHRETMGNIMRDPLMIVGDVTNFSAQSSGENKLINWNKGTSLKEKLPNTTHGTSGYLFIGGEGNGIVTTNGTIIFPIALARNNEMISSTLYSIDDGKTWNIGGATEPGTSSGSIVEWNNGKLLFVVSSVDGYRKVFESDNMGINWGRSSVLYGVWGNNPYRSVSRSLGSTVAVPVDKKDVLLFTHPLNLNGNDLQFDTLQIWMSDGLHIVCIGTISDKEKEENTANSILAYVGEHLYVTHRINPFGHSTQVTANTKRNWSRVIGLTPLPNVLEKVKTIARDWRQMDEKYQSIGISTNGLVGVLENSKDNAVWTDMYNCVNATVKGGQSVNGGFRFSGAAGSGAKWPVQSQGQNQLYKFTDREFTITANITIHSTSEAADVALIGTSARADGNSVLFGLGYTADKKWFALRNSQDKYDTEVAIVLDNEYEVVMTFVNGEGTVYVDGVNIAKQNIFIPTSVSISHFFIGGTGLPSAAANSNSCTVKNVMLFSRALQQSEIVQLAKIKGNSELNRETKTENEKNVPENRAENSNVKFPNAPDNQNSMLSKKRKKSSDIGRNNVNDLKISDEKAMILFQKSSNALFKINAKDDDDSAVSLSAVACLCFVCLLIALMGF